MKQYKNKLFYHCPHCNQAQEFVANPMYLHICTDCGKEYSNSKLISKVEKVRIV